MVTGAGGNVKEGVGTGVDIGMTMGVGSGVGAGAAVGTGVGEGVTGATVTEAGRVVVRVFFTLDPHPLSSVADSIRQVNEKLNPPAMLGRLEEDVSGMRK